MKSRRLLASAMLAVLPLAASAVPVTYEFSGFAEVGGGTAPPEGEIFEPIIPWGTAFTGSFTYETETPISNSAPGFTRYTNAITAGSISFGAGGSLGSFSFAPFPDGTQLSYISFVNDVEFGGNPPYDQFNLGFSLGNAPGDSPYLHRYVSFSTGDYTAQQLPAGLTLLDPLPVAALLSNFHQLSFGYTLYDAAGEYVEDSYVGSQNITLTLASAPSSVPEPATVSLLAAGLAGIWLASRGRRREKYLSS